jgi:hypothetical protein
MSFADNLLKKIEINSLADRILATIGPVGSLIKVDKDTMGRLLEAARYERLEKRELVLYCKKGVDAADRILVLDNDLSIYQTTLDDVLLRKNPTVKEMVSIRNAIKILNDKDVVVSKKEQSVRQIEKEAISLLDLSFTRRDIDDMEVRGQKALQQKDAEEIALCIDLFAELLGYQKAPAWLRLGGYTVRGGAAFRKNQVVSFGPVLIYIPQGNQLLLIDDRIESHENEKIELARRIAMGQEKPDRADGEVFSFLAREVVFHRLDAPEQKGLSV